MFFIIRAVQLLCWSLNLIERAWHVWWSRESGSGFNARIAEWKHRSGSLPCKQQIMQIKISFCSDFTLWTTRRIFVISISIGWCLIVSDFSLKFPSWRFWNVRHWRLWVSFEYSLYYNYAIYLAFNLIYRYWIIIYVKWVCFLDYVKHMLLWWRVWSPIIISYYDAAISVVLLSHI